MKKKIGDKYEGSLSTPIWAQIYNYKDTIFMTIFFTRQTSPRCTDWFKDIEDMGFKIISKGNYQYGYYYKILISKPIDKMQKVLNKLNKSNDFEFKYSVEDMYSKYVLDKL